LTVLEEENLSRGIRKCNVARTIRGSELKSLTLGDLSGYSSQEFQSWQGNYELQRGKFRILLEESPEVPWQDDQIAWLQGEQLLLWDNGYPRSGRKAAEAKHFFSPRAEKKSGIN
jgi:hypothetical protein